MRPVHAHGFNVGVSRTPGHSANQSLPHDRGRGRVFGTGLSASSPDRSVGGFPLQSLTRPSFRHSIAGNMILFVVVPLPTLPIDETLENIGFFVKATNKVFKTLLV